MNPLIQKNVLLIIRGVSGSGKTAFEQFLTTMIEGIEIVTCTADNFFLDDKGYYNFDVTKLGQAHTWCKNKAFRAMDDSIRIVIVSNTSCSEKEYKPYEEYARQRGYEVVSLVIENLTGQIDIHGVPQETLERQRNKLFNSLKL